jgi:hypothetical protein
MMTSVILGNSGKCGTQQSSITSFCSSTWIYEHRFWGSQHYPSLDTHNTFTPPQKIHPTSY